MDRKIKITISVDKAILEQFKQHCERHGMKVSSRINALMRNLTQGN